LARLMYTRCILKMTGRQLVALQDESERQHAIRKLSVFRCVVVTQQNLQDGGVERFCSPVGAD
jgi:hypothetical protein